MPQQVTVELPADRPDVVAGQRDHALQGGVDGGRGGDGAPGRPVPAQDDRLADLVVAAPAWPTAHRSLDEVPSIASSWLPSWPSGIGVATGVQLAPFHLAAMESKERCCMADHPGVAGRQRLDPEQDARPARAGTVVQLVPFQRWSNAADEAPLVKPTAQALVAELDRRRAARVDGGPRARHDAPAGAAVPPLDRGRRNGLLTSSARPTAHALEDEVASTPKSTLSNWGGSGWPPGSRSPPRRAARAPARWRPAAPPYTAGACDAAAQDSLLGDPPFHRCMPAATGGQSWR